MSEVIVRMEMPMPVKEWNCLDCKAICTDLMRGYYCGITKKTIDTLKNMRARPDWCPIVGELPEEHGDLIDRDELYMAVKSHDTSDAAIARNHNRVTSLQNISTMKKGYIAEKRICLDDIIRAEAVIKAERKDDEQIH